MNLSCAAGNYQSDSFANALTDQQALGLHNKVTVNRSRSLRITVYNLGISSFEQNSMSMSTGGQQMWIFTCIFGSPLPVRPVSTAY